VETVGEVVAQGVAAGMTKAVLRMALKKDLGHPTHPSQPLKIASDVEPHWDAPEMPGSAPVGGKIEPIASAASTSRRPGESMERVDGRQASLPEHVWPMNLQEVADPVVDKFAGTIADKLAVVVKKDRHGGLNERLRLDRLSCTVTLDGERYDGVPADGLAVLEAVVDLTIRNNGKITRERIASLLGWSGDKAVQRAMDVLPEVIRRWIPGTPGDGIRLQLPPVPNCP
jgi:hypothetical protein